MRTIAVVTAALFMTLPAAAEPLARPPTKPPLESLSAANDWLNAYRLSRDLRTIPDAMIAVSRHGGFRDPETSGVYVGFIAGALSSNRDRADWLVDEMLSMRVEDHWAIVRAIAYSGLPDWKPLLRRHAADMPTRYAMIQAYLDGREPALSDLVVSRTPTTWQRFRDAFAVDLSGTSHKPKRAVLEPNQIMLDVFWGQYLASGSSRPIEHMVDLLPWANDRDSVERLTVGSMAKYTLAANATRDQLLLGMLRTIRDARSRKPEINKLLTEVITAAELADTAALRQKAVASIELLKTKGPAYKRELSTWGKVGQGAIAVGCVAAAATGHVEFGLPCVIGGSTASAAMYYANDGK